MKAFVQIFPTWSEGPFLSPQSVSNCMSFRQEVRIRAYSCFLGLLGAYLWLLKAYWCLFVLIECLYSQLSCLLGLIRAYWRAIFSKIGSHKRQHNNWNIKVGMDKLPLSCHQSILLYYSQMFTVSLCSARKDINVAGKYSGRRRIIHQCIQNLLIPKESCRDVVILHENWLPRAMPK